MSTSSPVPSSSHEATIQSTLEWLAQAHDRTGAGDLEQLHQQLLIVRATPIPTLERGKLLDLFYTHAERIVHAELPELKRVTLPVSRRLRQRVRSIQEILETLAQYYLNTLAELFDPRNPRPARHPSETLHRVLQCIAWNIRVSHLAAAPTPVGLWLQMHTAVGLSQNPGIVESTPAAARRTLQKIYLGALLPAVAQSASFNASEQEFIAEWLEQSRSHIEITDTIPPNARAVFWIDPKSDTPAHAAARRLPPIDTPVRFFSCAEIAQEAKQNLHALTNGATAADLTLPAFADSPAGQGVLRRLVNLWGAPAKRKFPRRRLSYRALICSGLEPLWELLRTPGKPVKTSEWMVTNESPDGYAIMHVAGHTEHLQAGNLVAIQPIAEHPTTEPAWQICMVRWALSENPEHIELGLQLVSLRAIAAVVAQADRLDLGTTTALLLPEAPPLRQTTAVPVATGRISPDNQKLIVLLEKDNLEIREVRPTRIDEQTSSIEMFTIEPDATA